MNLPGDLDDDLRVELDADQSYIVDVLQSGSRRSGSSERMFNVMSPRRTKNGVHDANEQQTERHGEASNPTSARDADDSVQTKVFAHQFVNTKQ